MTEQNWEEFFALVDTIVNGNSSWEEKASAVIEKASEYNCENQFEELVGWFQNGDDDEDD